MSPCVSEPEPTNNQLSDGTVLTESYANELRASLVDRKEQKGWIRKDISNLQSEALVLQRTEDLLRKHHRSVDEDIKIREEKGGVKGYQEAKSIMHTTEETSAKVDELKGSTLQEISDTVQEIVKSVEEKKEKLQPMVSEL